MEPNKMSIANSICTRIKFIRCLGFSVIVILLLTTSCATIKKQPDPAIIKSEHHPSSKTHFKGYEIEQRLREEYERWKGTRHRLGGNDRNGIDCSGFVKAVYANLFEIHLPRTTQIQAKQGRAYNF